jgi:hypothetical protein
MIAQKDYLRGAVMEVHDHYHKLTEPWETQLCGLDLRAGWHFVANTFGPLPDRQGKLLTRPSTLAVID